MGTQVITIGPDGSLQGLMRKKGEGIDLREFGPAKIERTSLVEFDEERQLFHVQFIAGPLSGKLLTYPLFAACTGKTVRFNNSDHVMRFESYEEAVKYEIMVLDGYRARPILPSAVEALA